jgi:hypothetical protein
VETTEITEEQKEIQLAQSDLSRAKALVVNDAESYRDCCQIELQLKQAIKDAEKFFEKITKSTYDAWQAALDLKRQAVNPRQIALGMVQKIRLDWEREQERLRLEREQERQKQVNADAKAEAKQLAQTLKEAGQDELAKDLLSNVQAPVVTEPSTVPDRPKGIGSREVWAFRIKNEGRIPRTFMTPDLKKIQSIVDTQRKLAEKIIPGIEVYSETVARGAAKVK